MTLLRCNVCGARIETIPLSCGYDMTIDEETGEWQCFLSPELGYVNLNHLLCSNCCHTSEDVDACEEKLEENIC